MSTKKNLDKTIISSMKLVADDFHENELAYLALTSKIELPIRDKWAYILYKRLAHQEFIVSREWKRTDLAIIYKEMPKILIELKAIYTFDAIADPDNIKGYPKKMLLDREKASGLADDDTSIFTVLLATHPLDTVPTKLKKIVKYTVGINHTFCKLGNSKKIATEAMRIVNKKFENRNVVAKGVLSGGEAFDIGVEVMYWIIKG
jgi:hypothetical protein